MDVETDDAVLAARIARGDDREAEALLCRRWVPRIRAYGRLHLRDREAAEDLAQEVLVVLIAALREQRVGEPERLAAYVSGVCRNLTRDWKRGARRRGALLERFGPTWMDSVTPSPRVERTRLSDCLRRLAARDRAVVVLTFYADEDSDTIARDLAMTPGHVRVTRHRALKQLLDCIGGEA